MRTRTFDASASPAIKHARRRDLRKSLCSLVGTVCEMARSIIPRPFPANMPGVTVAWLAKANKCSTRTIRRWRASLLLDDALGSEMVADLTTDRAKEMALLRPTRGVLPLWCRLAIADLAARGSTYAELAEAFQVSMSTVRRAAKLAPQTFGLLTGQRLLTKQQAAPLPALRGQARNG